MSNNLEKIDNYFKGELTPEELREFDKKIIEDPEFAEDVAFYLATQRAAKELRNEEKKSGFKKIPLHTIPSEKYRGIRKLWPYMSAAAVISGLIIGWFVFLKPVSPQEMADRYIKNELQTVGVTMGIEDSLQIAKRSYNEGRLEEALRQFETIIRLDTSNFEAKKFAGIVSLRLNNFDQALSYFRQLETYTLYANPAKFYQALTLLKRNQPGDKQQAKQLLHGVVQNDLQGKETAQEWLKKL